MTRSKAPIELHVSVAGRTLRASLIAVAILLTGASHSRAEGEQYPNWESCSVDFWGNATDLRDLRNGVPVEKLGRNAGVIRDTLNDGVFKAVTTVQRVYAKCVQPFVKGTWIAPPPFEKYGGCAYASTIFLAVLLRLEKGDRTEQINTILPAQWHESAEAIARNFSESPDKAAILAMESTRDCVARATKDSTLR